MSASSEEDLTDSHRFVYKQVRKMSICLFIRHFDVTFNEYISRFILQMLYNINLAKKMHAKFGFHCVTSAVALRNLSSVANIGLGVYSMSFRGCNTEYPIVTCRQDEQQGPEEDEAGLIVKTLWNLAIHVDYLSVDAQAGSR
jgi:hypothetical protein